MRDLVDDSWWDEVLFINAYALFMGYLSMAIRGLGFLTITWTTVVLLGGFVSTLGNKDFWCLTMIGLLQTAGVYDVFLNEKLGYINQSAKIFWVVPLYRRLEYFRSLGSRRSLGCFIRIIPQFFAEAVQALVLGIVLCPLMALYMFGLLISTGISLWRLIEHDFGDGEVHLKPALQVLYSLAVLQGSLFIYRFIFSRKEKGLVKDVALEYEFGGDGVKLIADYARKLRIGCDKDPTFANGRNLITFAVDLIKTESPANYISGVTILDIMGHYSTQYSRDQHMLIKQLVGTTSSCTILQKLVQTLHESSPYDVDTRIRAARIVGYFADHFYLEQFPKGTQCIISLLSQACSRMDFGPIPRKNDTTSLSRRAREKEMEIRSSLRFRSNFLAAQGLFILCKLAAYEDNCRVLRTTHGLVSKIMAPVSFQGLHDAFHDVWSIIAFRSLLLLAGLMKNSPGEAGESLRHEISSNKEVISTTKTVFTGECPECGQELPGKVVETLLCFGFATSYVLVLPPASKGRFMKIVANMIVDDSKEDSLRTMACENLKGLCIQCTENAEFLQQLVEALTEVMPKVLNEIVPPYGSDAKMAGDVMQTSTEANNVGFSAPGTDVEKGPVSGDDEQHVYEKLSSQPYYLSLCVAIRDTLISAYPHLACQFDKLAADICPGEVKSFACLVNESQKFVDEKKKKSGGHSTTISKGDYRIGADEEAKGNVS